MNLMNWLQEKLHPHHKALDDRANVALAMTEEVTTSSRSLREQLEPYRACTDPFVAIGRAKSISQGEYD